MVQEGLALCRACNDRIPKVDRGREWEGFLLASCCAAKVGGTPWMRGTVLNKGSLEALVTGGEGGTVYRRCAGVVGGSVK